MLAAAAAVSCAAKRREAAPVAWGCDQGAERRTASSPAVTSHDSTAARARQHANATRALSCL